MIRNLVRLAALAAALSLSGLAARADIRLDVFADDAGQAQSATGTFGPGVTRVHGSANEALAHVKEGGHNCLILGNCPFLANVNALTVADFNADGMRWRVFAKGVGDNAQAASQLVVTDTLSVVGSNPGLMWLDFKVRVEFEGLFAFLNNNGGIQAGAEYTLALGTLGGETGNDFQPYFSLTASTDNYGSGQERSFSVTVPGQEAFQSIVIPSVYETTFSLPALGSSGIGSFDFMMVGSAGAYGQGGQGAVESLNSAYIGLSAVGASISSANGYTYTGYTGDGGPIAAVPEPSSVALMLLGGVVLAARGKWRRRQEQAA